MPALLLLAGCQSPEANYPDMDTPIQPKQAHRAPVSSRRALGERRALYRDEVSSVVDAGLGRFLQHLEVDATLEHGRFQGFRILRLMPPEFWQGVDLRPGDVVTRVNGMSIERPPEAHRAFTSLKQADHLVVSYLRAGERRELVYPIRDRPMPSRPAKAAPRPRKGG